MKTHSFVYGFFSSEKIKILKLFFFVFWIKWILHAKFSLLRAFWITFYFYFIFSYTQLLFTKSISFQPVTFVLLFFFQPFSVKMSLQGKVIVFAFWCGVWIMWIMRYFMTLTRLTIFLWKKEKYHIEGLVFYRLGWRSKYDVATISIGLSLSCTFLLIMNCRWGLQGWKTKRHVIVRGYTNTIYSFNFAIYCRHHLHSSL